ncbi:unnamed protein product [Musa acuminata subsp. burmannicoides]
MLNHLHNRYGPVASRCLRFTYTVVFGRQTRVPVDEHRIDPGMRATTSAGDARAQVVAESPSWCSARSKRRVLTGRSRWQTPRSWASWRDDEEHEGDGGKPVEDDKVQRVLKLFLQSQPFLPQNIW